MHILPLAVKEKDLFHIIRKKHPRKDVALLRKELFLLPLYYFEIHGSLRRGFGLPLREIPLYWTVNACNKQIHRLPHPPRYEDVEDPPKETAQALLSREEARDFALELAFKNISRSYKFLWKPTISLIFEEEIFQGSWETLVRISHKGKYWEENLSINAYSGRIHSCL